MRGYIHIHFQWACRIGSFVLQNTLFLPKLTKDPLLNTFHFFHRRPDIRSLTYFKNEESRYATHISGKIISQNCLFIYNTHHTGEMCVSWYTHHIYVINIHAFVLCIGKVFFFYFKFYYYVPSFIHCLGRRVLYFK